MSKFCWSLELKSRHIGRFRRHHGPDGPIFRDVQMSDSLPPAALKLPMRPHCAMGTPFRGSNTVFTVVFGVFCCFSPSKVMILGRVHCIWQHMTPSVQWWARFPSREFRKPDFYSAICDRFLSETLIGIVLFHRVNSGTFCWLVSTGNSRRSYSCFRILAPLPLVGFRWKLWSKSQCSVESVLVETLTLKTNEEIVLYDFSRSPQARPANEREIHCHLNRLGFFNEANSKWVDQKRFNDDHGGNV